MSEHFGIIGEADYWHLPYDDSSGATYCTYCKKTCYKIIVEYHQGLMDSTVVFRCQKCKKVMNTITGELKRDKEDKKCSVCKKKTSNFNSYCYGYISEPSKKRMKKYICCSKRCSIKHEKKRV